MLSLKNNNKNKNPKFRHFDDEDSESSDKKDTQNEFIYEEVEKIEEIFEFGENETFLKIINSEFGDAVILITNKNIYEVEFEAKSILVKSLDFDKKFSKYLLESLSI